MNKLPITLAKNQSQTGAARVSQQGRTTAAGGRSAQARPPARTHSSSPKQPGISLGTHAHIQRSFSACDETPAYIFNLHLNQEVLKQPNLHRNETWGSSKEAIFNFKRIPSHLILSPTETQRQHPGRGYRNYSSSSWQKKQNSIVRPVRKQGETCEINHSQPPQLQMKAPSNNPLQPEVCKH